MLWDAFARACASFSALDGRPRFLPVPVVDKVGLEVDANTKPLGVFGDGRGWILTCVVDDMG